MLDDDLFTRQDYVLLLRHWELASGSLQTTWNQCNGLRGYKIKEPREVSRCHTMYTLITTSRHASKSAQLRIKVGLRLDNSPNWNACHESLILIVPQFHAIHGSLITNCIGCITQAIWHEIEQPKDRGIIHTYTYTIRVPPQQRLLYT
jgi:hypothetical protein